jgi:hypothetical protein
VNCLFISVSIVTLDDCEHILLKKYIYIYIFFFVCDLIEYLFYSKLVQKGSATDQFDISSFDLIRAGLLYSKPRKCIIRFLSGGPFSIVPLE